jgi:hypothetical protein
MTKIATAFHKLNVLDWLQVQKHDTHISELYVYFLYIRDLKPWYSTLIRPIAIAFYKIYMLLIFLNCMFVF